jgi:hypothetical protein
MKCPTSLNLFIENRGNQIRASLGESEKIDDDAKRVGETLPDQGLIKVAV